MTGGPPTGTGTEISGATTTAHGPVGVAIDGALTAAAALSVRVQLTKQEVFEACQALADADPVLVAVGCVDEARALGDLFELLEDRLTGPPLPSGGGAV